MAATRIERPVHALTPPLRPSPLVNLRNRILAAIMSAFARRGGRARLAGLTLDVAPGVCNPAPLPGAHLGALFVAGVEGLGPHTRVLEIGTGSGVWALLATGRGARVVATDLPGVPLERVRTNAARNGVAAPDLRAGDLFAPVAGERFARILFNPPFHDGEPRSDTERAYMGGAGGAVVRRFLARAADHLLPDGTAMLVLPRIEQAAYADALAGWQLEPVAHQWVPLIGRVDLLRLTPNVAVDAAPTDGGSDADAA